MNQKAIEVEEFLPHPPARVWRALTERELLSRWLMATDVEVKVGASFTFDTGGWGMTKCEILAVEQDSLLSYTWVNPPLNTVVTWRLSPADGGTLLSVEHSGFDLDDEQQRVAFEGMGQGWRSTIFQRLNECLSELTTPAS